MFEGSNMLCLRVQNMLCFRSTTSWFLMNLKKWISFKKAVDSVEAASELKVSWTTCVHYIALMSIFNSKTSLSSRSRILCTMGYYSILCTMGTVLCAMGYRVHRVLRGTMGYYGVWGALFYRVLWAPWGTMGFHGVPGGTMWYHENHGLP